jgi:hypothetical protein
LYSKIVIMESVYIAGIHGFVCKMTVFVYR